MILWDDQNQPHIAGESDWHVHQCADNCGQFWVCRQRDGCDRAWTCPTCEQERRDHYVSLMAQKEETRDGDSR